MSIDIYINGCCCVHSERGGWGNFLQMKEDLGYCEKEVYGKESEGDAHRIQLIAAIRGFDLLLPVTIANFHTNSLYLKKGIDSQIKYWKNNHWKTKNNRPVKNADLWQQLDALNSDHKIRWILVKKNWECTGLKQAIRLSHQGLNAFEKNDQIASFLDIQIPFHTILKKLKRTSMQPQKKEPLINFSSLIDPKLIVSLIDKYKIKIGEDSSELNHLIEFSCEIESLVQAETIHHLSNLLSDAIQTDQKNGIGYLTDSLTKKDRLYYPKISFS